MPPVYPWSVRAGALRLKVKARPGQKRPRAPRIVDVGEGQVALEITVAEAAVEGRANAALITALAAWCKVKKADVTLVSGDTGSLKLFDIACADPAGMAAKFESGLTNPRA